MVKRECHPKWQGCVLTTVSTNDNLGDYRLKAGQRIQNGGEAFYHLIDGVLRSANEIHEGLRLPSHAGLVLCIDTSGSLVVVESFSANLHLMRLSLLLHTWGNRRG